MDDVAVWALKYLGACFGVLLSMVFIAPANTRNALYRVLLAPPTGVVFVPATQALVWFLKGDTIEMYIAAAVATGFTCWFILEFGARMLSQREWLEKLLLEILKLRSGGKG